MELTVAKSGEKEVWDGIVETSSHATIFHTWDWLTLMQKYSKKNILYKDYYPEFHPLIVRKKSEIVGLMPIFFFKTPVIKMAFSPPPATETLYLGPLILNHDLMNPHTRQTVLMEFQKTIDNYLKNELNSDLIQVSTPPGFSDPRAFSWTGYEVRKKFTYVIDLKKGADIIWNMFPKMLKRDLHRFKENGFEIKERSWDEFRYIYTLLKERKRIYTVENFLKDIYSRFSRNIRVTTIGDNDTPVTGMITFYHDNKVNFWLGCPKCTVMGASPNTFLIWESILWAIDHGFGEYEIMGADDQALFPFKSKFNGELVPFYSLRWLSPVFRVVKAWS